MKASHRPATQLPFAGSTSSEGTDDDGDIKFGRLKTPSCKVNIAIRLKRVCHFRCKSECCRFRKLLDEVISQALSNALIVSGKEETRKEQDKATDWDPESDNEISFFPP
ncbi:hypothetical protein LSAT2_004188, partial [Lamellibrachia satsuma]